jgi:hypothetical protein
VCSLRRENTFGARGGNIRSYAIFFLKGRKEEEDGHWDDLDWIPCHMLGREEKKSQATTTTKKRERDLFKNCLGMRFRVAGKTRKQQKNSDKFHLSSKERSSNQYKRGTIPNLHHTKQIDKRRK